MANGDFSVDSVNLMQWSRVELEDFTSIWHRSTDRVRENGDVEGLRKFLNEDTEFTWCVPGIDPEYLGKIFHVVGVDEILKEAEKGELFGIKGWSRPWTTHFIDSHKGVIMYLWEEVSPYLKKDGTPFTTRTIGTTRIHYAGSYQIREIEVVVDPEYLVALKDELIAAGLAPESIVKGQAAYREQVKADEARWNEHLAELEKGKPGAGFVLDLNDKTREMPGDYPAEKGEAAEPIGISPQSSAEEAVYLRKNDEMAREDHEAVRKHVGYYDFTHKLLKVTGLDARSFLSKMFVGSVEKASIGQGKYTTMLNEDGTIIDDVIVFRIEEDCFWVSTLFIEELISWFKSHRTYEDVEFEEITAKTSMYAVQGPASRAVLNEIVAKPINDLKFLHISDNSISGKPVKIARSGYTGELGYEVYCSPDFTATLESRLDEAGKKYGIRKITTDVIITSLPREKGFVLMSDLVGSNPLEDGFDWTINWNKRFVGKAALSRIEMQTATRSLLGFIVDNEAADIQPGSEVLVNGETVGKVTVFTYGFSVEKNIGFAIVDARQAQAGDRAIIVSQGNHYAALLTDRVFYDIESERNKEKNIAELESRALV